MLSWNVWNILKLEYRLCKKCEIKKESLYDLYISSITQVNTKNCPASRRYLYTE